MNQRQPNLSALTRDFCSFPEPLPNYPVCGESREIHRAEIVRHFAFASEIHPAVHRACLPPNQAMSPSSQCGVRGFVAAELCKPELRLSESLLPARRSVILLEF